MSAKIKTEQAHETSVIALFNMTFSWILTDYLHIENMEKNTILYEINIHRKYNSNLV
jgi:hypothetical protein